MLYVRGRLGLQDKTGKTQQQEATCNQIFPPSQVLRSVFGASTPRKGLRAWMPLL